jgi:hypothetical protein
MLRDQPLVKGAVTIAGIFDAKRNLHAREVEVDLEPPNQAIVIRVNRLIGLRQHATWTFSNKRTIIGMYTK